MQADIKWGVLRILMAIPSHLIDIAVYIFAHIMGNFKTKSSFERYIVIN